MGTEDTLKVGANPTTPGTADKAAKPKKTEEELKAERIAAHEARNHPAIAGNSDVKLKELPPDWDFDAFNPVKRKNFEKDDVFYEYKVSECEWKARKYKEKAEEARTLGSAADRGKAKRLRSMQEKMAELRAELEAQGVNVDELLAKPQ